MLSCGMMPAPSAYPLEQGFDEAWAQIRRETEAVRTPVECTTCPRREMCSVCAAVCVTETGAPDRVPKYVCAMTQATAQAYENWRKDS